MGDADNGGRRLYGEQDTGAPVAEVLPLALALPPAPSSGATLAQLYEDAFQALQDAKKSEDCGELIAASVLYASAVELFLQVAQQEPEERNRGKVLEELRSLTRKAETLSLPVAVPASSSDSLDNVHLAAALVLPSQEEEQAQSAMAAAAAVIEEEPTSGRIPEEGAIALATALSKDEEGLEAEALVLYREAVDVMLNELEAEQRYGKGGLDTAGMHRLVEQALERVKVLEGLQAGCENDDARSSEGQGPCVESEVKESKRSPGSDSPTTNRDHKSTERADGKPAATRRTPRSGPRSKPSPATSRVSPIRPNNATATGQKSPGKGPSDATPRGATHARGRSNGGSGSSGGSGGSGRRGLKSPSGGGGGGTGGTGGRGRRPSGARLAPSEIDVLRRSSFVNGRLFLPWALDEKRESFLLKNRLYTDPTGLLPLSPKQRRHFAAYRRPHEIMAQEPVMIKAISPYNIVQDVIGDCSFVASLCITAAFERRFRKQLITGIIYPQDPRTHLPVYNPSGKYLCKLWINGVARRVEVDDRLPVDRRGGLLCARSSISNELWVSILEKAYMKVNGGYDFPGSNSGVDLYALTGWIPETVHMMEKDPDEELRRRMRAQTGLSSVGGMQELPLEQSPDRVWERLVSANRYGDCLITVATGDVSAVEEERLGLVPTHAYAVLQVWQGHGRKLLQLKNPWASRPWSGRYSVNDNTNWTSELRRLLQYPPDIARQLDRMGIFWVDFETVQHYFNSVHLNWNPNLFQHQAVTHANWPTTSKGPRNDQFNVGENPQFTLEVTRGGTVWILLSRHVTKREAEIKDESEGDFLALHVYTKRKGARVFYPDQAIIRGLYSNNPHNLTRFDVDELTYPKGEERTNQGRRKLTLVLSQYEKRRSVDYTIRVLSTKPFQMLYAPTLPTHAQQIKGAWGNSSSGGSMNEQTYSTNPQYRFTVRQRIFLHAQLLAPVKYSGNITIVRWATNGRGVNKETGRVSYVTVDGEAASSGSYRRGFCYVETDRLEPGEYTLVVSTFRAGERGNFFLNLHTTSPLPMTLIVP